MLSPVACFPPFPPLRAAVARAMRVHTAASYHPPPSFPRPRTITTRTGGSSISPSLLVVKTRYSWRGVDHKVQEVQRGPSSVRPPSLVPIIVSKSASLASPRKETKASHHRVSNPLATIPRRAVRPTSDTSRFPPFAPVPTVRRTVRHPGRSRSPCRASIPP